jgi:cytochrome c
MARIAWIVVGLLAVLALIGGYVGNRLEARHRLQDRVAAMTGGDAGRGRSAIQKRPCGGCHQIPGVPGAQGSVGPPLTAFARRGYVAGRLSNTPDNLIRFLENPHAVDPESAMPPMGINEPEARDMAAYLYTLR